METKARFFFVAILLIIGLEGIAAQTVLLRELLIVFTGNELSMGIIIGTWVIWEAAGAYLGGKGKMPLRTGFFSLTILTLLFTVIFPLSIYLTRTFKALAGMSMELSAGPSEMFAVSFLVLLPVGFIHGFLFTLSCTLWNHATGETASTGKVYYYEMLGTITGGILVNFLLIPYFSSFRIAIGLVCLTGLICFLFLLSIPSLKMRSVAAVIIACVTLLSVGLLLGGGADRLHQKTIQAQWQGKDVVFFENSRYQNIVVTKAEDQYTFFSDGVPFMTTPLPDIAFTEEFTHFPLLSHPHPQRVLILGGGAGGPISETLKYPTVASVDYVEMDPMLLEALRRFPTPLTDKELRDTRVRLHFVDGRTFLRDSKERYDVILVGLPPPRSLQQNRFFTEEFFHLAKKRLNRDGILALPMTGSSTYYSHELKALNLCLMTTLKGVFPSVFVIPGDINLFMASRFPLLTSTASSLLSKRLKERNVPTLLINETHLAHRLLPEKRGWFLQSLQGKDGVVNRDFSPRGLLCSLAYDNLLHAPSAARFLRRIESMSPWHGFVLTLVLLLFFYCLSRRYRRLVLVYVIGTTGFTAMSAELGLLFTFQIFYGHVFYEVGILLTLFMGGMAAGSLLTFVGPVRTRSPFPLLLAAETGFVVLTLLLATLLYHPSLLSLWDSIPASPAVLVFLFLAGLFTGMEFPLAVTAYDSMHLPSPLPDRPHGGRSAGILYSVDLLGGWVGGLVAGFLLLPALGLPQSCLLLAALKAGSLLLLSISRQK